MSAKGLPFRQVLAVSAGNALGFYDFLTYSYFAKQIGETFFPAHDPANKLLLSLAVFGVGFFTRPVGAIVLGTMGDKIGRKPALIISFMLMGVGILGLALTPSYASIGIAAPILVIFFRLLQGFALGGEVGPTTAYMLEAAPPNRRGLYASFQATTQDFATLCAGIIGFTLANYLTADQLQEYGWRIAFLIGASIIPFVLIARRNLEETFAIASDPAAPPVKIGPHLPLAFLGLVIIGTQTILSYTLGYMTTFAQTSLNISANIAFIATILNGGSGFLFDSVSGWLSDKYGRKPVMIIPTIGLILATIPVFYMMVQSGSTAAFLSGVAIIALFGAFNQPPVLVALTEALPSALRSRGLAIVYAVAISTFGGSTQFVIQLLINLTHNTMMPAWILTPVSALGLIAMFLLPETAPAKAKRAG